MAIIWNKCEMLCLVHMINNCSAHLHSYICINGMNIFWLEYQEMNNYEIIFIYNVSNLCYVAKKKNKYCIHFPILTSDICIDICIDIYSDHSTCSHLLFILVLCAMLQNSREFNIIKQAIFDWRLAIHFINIFVRETITHRCEQLA